MHRVQLLQQGVLDHPGRARGEGEHEGRAKPMPSAVSGCPTRRGRGRPEPKRTRMTLFTRAVPSNSSRYSFMAGSGSCGRFGSAEFIVIDVDVNDK